MAPKKKGAKAPATTPDDSRDNLLRQMDGDNPEAFRFGTDGNMIVGKVVRFATGFSKYGPHPVVVIADETNGELRSVHCMQTVLRNQMTEADPQIGDRIAVKYMGEVTPKAGGAEYHNFRVRVDSARVQSFSEIAGRIADAADHDDDDDDTEGEPLPF